MALLLLPLAPIVTSFSGPGFLLFVAVAFGTRSIIAIVAAEAVFSLASRLAQTSSWHDQHWVQWSSISSLLTGHNIFYTSPLYLFSLSSYMPAGDLFGGLLIALGVQRYWIVWHLLVLCLLALPVVLSPSFSTLVMFIGFASFFPFSDYTTAGGTVEIAYALMIGAIAIFRFQGLSTACLSLLAFAAMFRQPALVIVPFVLLILWRARDLRRALIFGILLFLFGGIYIVSYPTGAYHYLYEVWEGYHQGLFNAFHGLRGNYSISSLAPVFGVSDSTAWYGLRKIYVPIMIGGIFLLFGAAWNKKKHEEVLLLGVLASVAVYVLSRGYAQLAYVCSAAFPLVAFTYPIQSRWPVVGRRFATGLTLVIVWIGMTPAFLYVGAWTLRKTDELRDRPRVIHSVESHEVGAMALALPPLDGSPNSSQVFNIATTVQFHLPSPEYLSGIRLSCGQIPIQNIKGVLMPFPTETQMRGAITEGIVEGSEDGISFSVLRHFRNSVNYCIWPGTISLPLTTKRLFDVRLKPLKLYLDEKQWVVGNVEFLVERKY